MQNQPRLFASGLFALVAAVAMAAPGDAPVSAPAAAPAASPASTGQTAVVADFSKGFALLHSLGITNVAKATYVTLSGPEAMGYVYRSMRYGLTGNAWQLSGDSTNGLFLLNETMLVRATTAPLVITNQMEQMRLMRYGGDSEDEGSADGAVRTLHGVKWKPADLQADLDRLLPKLQKEADKYLAAKAKEKAESEGEDENMRRMREMRSAAAGGDIGQWVSCLLSAAHYADQGHLPEANRLASLAMTLGGGNVKLLEAVMESLGNEAYQKVWSHFRATGDWNAYAAGIDGVVTRFPRGWQPAAGARQLAPRLRAFGAAGAKPAPLKTPLPADAAALADALATAPASHEADYAYQQPSYWVLPRDTNDYVGAWVATNAHPLARLLRSGTNAIPVLLALMDDQATFTRVQAYGMPASTNAAAADEAEDDTARMMREMAMSRSASLARPATRGEIATQVLQALVGEDRQAYYSRGRRGAQQGKSLAERVRTWQEEHAGMTAEDLAMACLTGKDYSQRSQAVQYLAASKSPSAWQSLEKFLLGKAESDDTMWLAQSYVSRRGKAAKPFVDAFEARITGGAAPTNAVKAATGEEEELFKASGGRDDSSRKYRLQQQQRTLKEMRRVVDAKPFDAVVEEIASGKVSPEVGRENMARSFYETSYAERVMAAIRGAAKAQAADVRISLLNLTSRPDTRLTAQYEYMMAQRGMPVAKSEIPAVAPLADAWRTLLSDTRATTNRTATFWQPALTVREVAALNMEAIYAPPATNGLDVLLLFNELGSDSLQLLLKRAESRLSGAAVVQPALPDPAAVTPARLAELTNSLTRATPGVRATQVASLNPDERLVVSRAARTNPNLAAALAPVAHRMRAKPSATSPAAASAALQGCDGKTMDVAALQALARQCADLAKQGQPVTFELLRRSGCNGVDVAARIPLPGDAVGVAIDPSIGIGVETLDGAPETMLLHPGAPAAATPDAASASDDPLKRPTDVELVASEIARIQRGPMTAAEAEAGFWKRLDALCTTDPAVGFPAGIRITPVAPVVPVKATK